MVVGSIKNISYYEYFLLGFLKAVGFIKGLTRVNILTYNYNIIYYNNKLSQRKEIQKDIFFKEPMCYIFYFI